MILTGGVVTAAFSGHLLGQFSQLLWPDKDREVWFSLGENHGKAYRSPDFL
jgi:hypothetical protein